MALYLIGDLQSCCTPFKELLQKIDFSPSRDELLLLGDVLNRGPESLATLDTVLQYRSAIRCLLGNHDFHFLAVAYGLRRQRRHDTLTPVLESPKKESYMEWLRQQSMALYEQGWLMVHAGVAAEWTLEDTLSYAQEVEQVVRSADIKHFLQEVFGDTPDLWSDNLQGMDRLRFITSVLTRIRFCYSDGRLDFVHKRSPQEAPKELTPWFDLPNRKTKNTPIAFGHWSTVGNIFPAPNLLALDTGCLWGGKLTAACLQKDTAPQIIQVDCSAGGIKPIKDSKESLI